MRRSARGFYEIDGRALRGVSDVTPGPGAPDRWRDRQADLWAEASSLLHVNHRLTDEELGLWGAMEKELTRVGRTITALELAARSDPR
jgi:hypothetical protein